MKRLPAIAIALVVIGSAVVDLDFKLWLKQHRVIEWDVHSYYAYLPALFIYNDITLQKYGDLQLEDGYKPFWPTTLENGGRVIKTSMGVSILYAPFFFMAHVYEFSQDLPANGFSETYKIALLIGALFYLAMGLIVLKGILHRMGCSPVVTAITLLLIGAGTNLFYYASIGGSMSHVFSFFLICCFLRVTMDWHQRPSWKRTLLIGILIGLISLARPTNVIIALFFVLLDVHDRRSAVAKMHLFLREWKKIMLILTIAFLIWVPQMIYWKTITGHFLFNPYVNERFYFDDPQFLKGLFSYRKGWLLYTPVMAFAIGGILLLRGGLRRYRLAVIAFLVLDLYIILSWWCWWYGGSFGQRALVDSYGLMAIPLAAFVAWVVRRSVAMKVITSLAGIFLIWLNIFQAYQIEVGSLHFDAMTEKAYWAQFGNMEKVPEFYEILDEPDYAAALAGDR